MKSAKRKFDPLAFLAKVGTGEEHNTCSLGSMALVVLIGSAAGWYLGEWLTRHIT